METWHAANVPALPGPGAEPYLADTATGELTPEAAARAAEQAVDLAVVSRPLSTERVVLGEAIAQRCDQRERAPDPRELDHEPPRLCLERSFLCLVLRLECGADALDNRVEFGVWGGMTERQRRALLKQHPEVVSWADFFAAQRKHRSAV